MDESLYNDLPGVISHPRRPHIGPSPGFSLVPELAGEE